jgi:hypothetical protein
LIILPERPDISMSLPVRRTILSELPVAHIVLTMQPMHSAVPGSGVNLHLEQLMIRASSDTDADGAFEGRESVLFLPSFLPDGDFFFQFNVCMRMLWGFGYNQWTRACTVR